MPLVAGGKDILCPRGILGKIRFLSKSSVAFKNREIAYLWSRHVCEDSPPKEAAIVLNSTCLTLSEAEGSDVSWWTM